MLQKALWYKRWPRANLSKSILLSVDWYLLGYLFTVKICTLLPTHLRRILPKSIHGAWVLLKFSLCSVWTISQAWKITLSHSKQRQLRRGLRGRVRVCEWVRESQTQTVTRQINVRFVLNIIRLRLPISLYFAA